MKTLFSFIISTMMAVSAFAGSLRITLNGNKNFQVVVDGRTYTPNYGGKEILISDLSAGSHNVEILRVNARGVNKQLYSSSFYIASNQEIHLTVNGNGSIRREESTTNDAYGYGNNSNNYRSPMSESSFRQLYQNVSIQRLQSVRLSAARNVFNNTGYYFSTAQARQIIQLINNENSRLELAKLSYDNIVDQGNFSQLYDLFSRQSSRDELDSYMRDNGNSGYYNQNSNYGYRTPMTESSFNTLYNDIKKRWLPGAKQSAALDAFNNSSNYFTTAQARQIIALVSLEENRLELAKQAYDNITDPANFRQVYDLLSSQSARDELDTYIRNNYNNYNNRY